MSEQTAKRRINVKASLRVARDPDFHFDREEELDEKTAGACAEGHAAKDLFVFVNARTGEEVRLGSTCKFKPFLFRRWPNLREEDLYDETGKFDKAFESIGRNLWKITKDHLEPEIADAEKSLGFTVDVSRVPPKSSRPEIAAKFSKIVSKAIAIRKARIKAEKLKKAKLAAERRGRMYTSRTSTRQEIGKQRAERDDLYKAFREVRFASSNAEYTRKDMLAKYIEYGGNWSEAQRGKVNAMLKHEPREGSTKPLVTSEAPVSGRMQMLAAIVKITSSNAKNEKIAGFLKSIYDRISVGQQLSTKQRGFLVKVLFSIEKIQDDSTMVNRILVGFNTVDEFVDFVKNVPAYESRA